MASPFLSAEEYDEQAHEHYDAGEFDTALGVLREGLGRHPDAVLLHVGVGYVHMAREEFIWAHRAFRHALTLDAEYEDAWVGLGETLLKFGQLDEALACFTRIDEMGLADDLDLGLTIGRVLYREGMFADARQRFAALVALHPDSAELAAARGYTQHALGDDLGARRELRRALRLDPDLHEARVYLAHLLYDRGDHARALRELERVPPEEHWDTLSLWRYLELKTAAGTDAEDAALQPWRARLAELETEPDAIDHLLAEVEAAFESADDDAPPASEAGIQLDLILRSLAAARDSGNAPRPAAREVHRVRTREGREYEGTWEEIVRSMRDASARPRDSAASFMRRAAREERERTGRELPADSAEAFLRAAARIGLLRIEA